MSGTELIKSLSDSVCWRIASKLDRKESPNWKVLIKEINSTAKTYNEKAILKFQLAILKPHGSPTLQLLGDLGRKKKTVLQLITWMKTLKDFPDLVELLERGEDAIKLSAPAIITQPQSEVYEVGEILRMSFDVRGENPLKFQWYKGSLELSNQTQHVLTLTDLRIEDTGFYICRVSNEYGYVFTDWAKVDVSHTPYRETFNEPIITMHPRSMTYGCGETLILYADAVGNPAPFLQWFLNDEALLGKCQRELTIPNVLLGEHDGLYKLKASNKHGSAVSLPAQISIGKSERVEIPDEPCIGRKATVKGQTSGRGPDVDVNDTGVSIVAPNMPSEKFALVIGNEDYVEHDSLGQLVHPINDSYEIAAALMSIGFKVVSLVNLDLDSMKKAVQFFCSLLDSGSYALFYFAGHGFEIDGENYLMPVNATSHYKPSENISLSNVLKSMTGGPELPKLNVLLLDCCRTEPDFLRKDPIPKLWQQQRKNVVIGYGCCSKGRVLESPMMKNGYFAQCLAENIVKEIKIDEVLFEVSRAIHQERIVDPATGRTQVVYRHSTVVDECKLTDLSKSQANLTEKPFEKTLLWQQAHKAPMSPVTILDNELGTVKLIFTAQFSNCLLIQSDVKPNPNTTAYSVMFILPQTIGGAQVEIITPEKDEKVEDKVVRISRLEYLEGDINIHVQVQFEVNGVLQNQAAFYRITEMPLYAKVSDEIKQLTLK